MRAVAAAANPAKVGGGAQPRASLLTPCAALLSGGEGGSSLQHLLSPTRTASGSGSGGGAGDDGGRSASGSTGSGSGIGGGGSGSAASPNTNAMLALLNATEDDSQSTVIAKPEDADGQDDDSTDKSAMIRSVR